MSNLISQVVLVTGASRGIGAAIAQALGEQGATVIGTATSAGGAENINASLKAAGIKGLGMVLDVNEENFKMHLPTQYQEQFKISFEK